MKLKDGVKLDGLRQAISRLLPSIELLFKQASYSMEITCTTGSHPEDDPHTHGFAIDCRVHGLAVSVQSSLRFAIGDFLGPRYTVLLENPGTPNEHIHIQLRKDLWHEIVAEEEKARTPGNVTGIANPTGA